MTTQAINPQSASARGERIGMKTFKAGDWVWFPSGGTKAFKLKERKNETWPVMIDSDDCSCCFDANGIFNTTNLPAIFHATPENKAALEVLYPEIEFQDPPSPKTGSDLTRELLGKGKPVLCSVGHQSDDKAVTDGFLTNILGWNGDSFTGTNGRSWKFAVPILRSCVDRWFTFPDEVQP